MSSIASRHGWTPRRVAVLCAMVAVVAWWGRLALEDIYRFATGQTDNGYILLAPAVGAYLAWLRRSRLQFLRYRPNLFGAALVLVGMAGSLWGDESGYQLFWHAGVMVAIVGCVYSMTGWELVRQFAPVLLAVALMIPVPGRIRDALAGPAQEFSVAASHATLEILGVDAGREGNVLIIDGQPVAVGEACNGMRMVFALGLVVFAFVFSVPFSGVTRLVLVCAAPIVALTCNIVRLVPTSIAFGWFSSDLAQQIHDIGGWVMLPLALVMLMGIVKVLRWLDLPVMSWRLLPS